MNAIIDENKNKSLEIEWNFTMDVQNANATGIDKYLKATKDGKNRYILMEVIKTNHRMGDVYGWAIIFEKKYNQKKTGLFRDIERMIAQDAIDLEKGINTGAGVFGNFLEIPLGKTYEVTLNDGVTIDKTHQQRFVFCGENYDKIVKDEQALAEKRVKSGEWQLKTEPISAEEQQRLDALSGVA